MALYKVVVRKAISVVGIQAKWSNSYYVDTLSAVSAAAAGVQIWEDAERLFHRTNVYGYESFASSVAEGDDDYYAAPIAGIPAYGALTSNSQPLPLFNVVRVDINVAAGGRPSRKFYRLLLEENDTNANQIVSGAVISAITAGMAALLALPEVKDESGGSFSSSVLKGVTARRLGKFYGVAVPPPPALSA